MSGTPIVGPTFEATVRHAFSIVACNVAADVFQFWSIEEQVRIAVEHHAPRCFHPRHEWSRRTELGAAMQRRNPELVARAHQRVTP